MKASASLEPNARSCDRNVVLDGMRGVAALVVMLLHYTEKNDGAVFGGVKLFGSGYLAVDLFFALSGFVIYRSYAGALAGRMSAQDYVAKRAIRLYPMYFVGLVLGVAALLLAAHDSGALAKAAILRDVSFNALGLPCPNVDATLDFGAAAATVGVLFPVNPPSWSLFFEMLASLAFLFLFRCDERRLLWIATGSLAALLLCGAIVSIQGGRLGLVLALGWGTSNFLGGFPRVFFSFTLGLLLCAWFMKAPRRGLSDARAPIAAVAIYALVTACLVAPNLTGGFYEAFVMAVLSPALVIGAAHVQVADGATKRISDFLGWLSYPLYCVHYPIGRIVWRLGQERGLSSGANIAACALISVGAAIFLAAFFDEPVRRWLSRLARDGVPALRPRRAARLKRSTA